MHSLVKTCAVQMLSYLVALFSGMILFQHSGTPSEQCSLILYVSQSVSVGIVLTRLAVLLIGGGSFHSLSPFLDIHGHPLLSTFNCGFTNATIRARL